MLNLEGQVAVVTGANRGLGKAIAFALHGAGANVVAAARTEETLNAVVTELNASRPASALALGTDVASAEQVNRLTEQAMDRWGRIDILVNNAGLVSPAPFVEIDAAGWQTMLDVNLTGAFHCCRTVAPIMQQQSYGRIVNIASITAQTGGVSGGAHYAASKGGLISMTKTIARDLAPFGITVNAIAPGQIDTRADLLSEDERRHVEALIPLGRLGTPDEIAFPVLFLASS